MFHDKQFVTWEKSVWIANVSTDKTGQKKVSKQNVFIYFAYSVFSKVMFMLNFERV